MGSNLPPNTEAQRDRFNVEIVPGASIDNAFPPHFLRTHFHRGVRLDSAFSRIHGWCGDTCFEDPSKAQDRLMREVIEWFDLDGSDNKWVGQRLRWKSRRPSASESLTTLIAQLSIYTQDENDCPDSLLYLIAVQLLASCYTLSIRQSACSLPLESRTHAPEFITTLRMLRQYRFSPAAGHHARDSSAESCWPGLYKGPSLEERIADQVSLQRMRANRMTDEDQRTVIHQPFDRSRAWEWTDGPAITEANHRTPMYDSTPSTSEPGCFPLFRTHQPNVLKLVKHPRYAIHPHTPRNHQSDFEHPTHKLTLKSLASIFPPKIYYSLVKTPPKHRLRSQSAPRRSSDMDIDAPPQARSRHRSSSTSALASPFVSPHELPAIRRWSATSTEGTEGDSLRSLRPRGSDYFEQIFPSRSATLSSASENTRMSADRPSLARRKTDSTLERLRELERASPEWRMSVMGSVYPNKETGKTKGYGRFEDREAMLSGESWSEDSSKRRLRRVHNPHRPSLTRMSSSDDSMLIWDRRRHAIVEDIGWFDHFTAPGKSPRRMTDDIPVPLTAETGEYDIEASDGR